MQEIKPRLQGLYIQPEFITAMQFLQKQPAAQVEQAYGVAILKGIGQGNIQRIADGVGVTIYAAKKRF